jgi:hypothetical protein
VWQVKALPILGRTALGIRANSNESKTSWPHFYLLFAIVTLREGFVPCIMYIVFNPILHTAWLDNHALCTDFEKYNCKIFIFW